MSERPLGPLMVDVAATALGDEEAQFLLHPAVGGVILFARNYRDPAQLRALTAQIKGLRSPSLLVAVDQEGGAVQRLAAGFQPLPAVARIGEVYDRDAARGLSAATAAGHLMASEVRAAGVDFSFAPVLDCHHPGSRVIGARAFHRDPAAISALAGAYITGMHRAGMAATAKHFPGHGGVRADSHRSQPQDTRTAAALNARDLLPYRDLAARLGGVMTAHVRFPAITPELPLCSPHWLGAVLRRDLGFRGVIFSDDLGMKGAGRLRDLPALATAARAAGCDMLLMCNRPHTARHLADHLHRQDLPPPHNLHMMRPREVTASATVGQLAAALESLLAA